MGCALLPSGPADPTGRLQPSPVTFGEYGTERRGPTYPELAKTGNDGDHLYEPPSEESPGFHLFAFAPDGWSDWSPGLERQLVGSLVF